ncbi:hypothetical protein D0T49_05340 [Paludibacter sp. 221]|uniref:hypothetical protein n=1 Tax=Paludibacter sp. 221 TaxID=2302939 RepID=UPI0013D23791|nr:hypothetical protein [Paludibacter sp. 221]NDV46464.1 hypothetical protein [Paludibacter sp. 221]
MGLKIKQVFLLKRQGFDIFKMQRGMIIQIKSGNTALSTSLIWLCWQGPPKPADAIGFTSRFGNITRVENKHPAVCAVLIHKCGVKVERIKIAFKLLTVPLFIMVPVSARLQKIHRGI